MKIHLITLAAFPFTSAESVHLAMFGKAMDKHCDFLMVTPLKPWRPKTWTKNILNTYGVANDSFRQMKHLQVLKKGTDFIKNAIDHAKKEQAFVYARQGIIAEAAINNGLSCCWEIHSIPDRAGFLTIKAGLSSGLLKKIVVISKALKDEIINALKGKALEQLISVHPDAADEERFLPYTIRRGDARLKIGYVGSIYPGKGIEVLVPLAAKCPEHEFLVYGAERKELPLILREGLTSNIKFMGKVPYKDIPKVMSTFDIALLPNQPSVLMNNGDDIGKYTSPMKLFEYMASGKAIVASKLAILQEVLKDNHNAILAPYNDIEQWSAAINRLVNNKELRQKLSENARIDFKENYTYSSRAAKIVKILNSG